MKNKNPNSSQTRDELQQKFLAEIKANKNFERFFKDYTQSTVNTFINHYAAKKAMWTIHGPLFKNELERLESQWVNEAMERLEEIQQVKLFLFQCKFRAGAMAEPVEGVRTIFDFLYWKENILNARFLEPITESDVRMYSDYMMDYDGNHNPLDFLHGWQDFDAIRKAYNDEDETDRTIPEWYDFYFMQTGHGPELNLPDIKKEKDLFYFSLGNNERIRLMQEAEKEAIAANPALAPEAGAYFADFENNNLSRFMNLFEDKENRKMHEVWLDWCDFTEKEELLREDLEMLMYAKEDIPVEESKNWIEAIQIAAARFRSKKIAESLPAAFEQYKMSLDLNISFPEKEESTVQSDFYNNLVLMGRRLNGEEENFDY